MSRSNPLVDLVVTALGGAAGALAAGLLTRSGVRPPIAAAAVAGAGGVAAAFTRGNVRLLASGAAAVGVGQLALTLLRGPGEPPREGRRLNRGGEPLRDHCVLGAPAVGAQEAPPAAGARGRAR